MRSRYDAVIVGAGPNGLAAGIALLQAGWSTLVLEAAPTPGGGARSSERTLPAFIHDNCSAIHPLAVGSPFFRTLPLGDHGLAWAHPGAPVGHPLDGGRAALLERSLDATVDRLGPDGAAYRRWVGPLVDGWEAFAADALGPLNRLPRRPGRLLPFALRALRSARGLADSELKTDLARGLFAGLAAHGSAPLDRPLTASLGLVLAAAAHAVGWPAARGGSAAITAALVSLLRSLGGELECGHPVGGLNELPDSGAVLFDTTPHQMVQIAGDALPARYRRAVGRFRRGPGVFKLDYALDGPVPWAAPECGRAGTIHVGGTLEQISESESAVAEGRCPERPYVLVAQQSRFDSTRAPLGKETLWAYCHVPNGSDADMSERIEAQLERFAPGFGARVLSRAVMRPADLERYDANYLGGDISGGSTEGLQLLFRPLLRWDPYATPNPRLYLCSSSTPPGPGVHGMCGYFAARAVWSSRPARGGRR